MIFFFSFFLWFLWRQIKLQHKRVLETQFMSLVLLYDSSAILSELSLSLSRSLCYCHLIIWKRPFGNFRELTLLYQPQSLAWKLKENKRPLFEEHWVWFSIKGKQTQNWIFMKKRKIRVIDTEVGLVLSPVLINVLRQVFILPETLLLQSIAVSQWFSMTVIHNKPIKTNRII